MSIRLRLDNHDSPASKKVKREDSRDLQSADNKTNHLKTLPQHILDHMLQNLSNTSYIHFTRVCWAKDLDFEKTTTIERTAARKAVVEDPDFWKAFYKKRFTDKPPSFGETQVCRKVCQLSTYFFGYGAQTKLKLGRKQLFTAIQQGYEKIVSKFFVEHPYDQELLNKALLGFTSLGRTSVEVLRALLNAGADINVKDSKYRIPLCYAEAEFPEALAKFVLDRTSGLEVTTKLRQISEATPLHYAAADGQEEVVQVLLDAGVKVDPEMIPGTTPLHMAAENGYAGIVHLLIKGGANANKYAHQRTPLHMAVLANSAEVVQVLLEAGANTKVKDGGQLTLLHRAAEKGCEKIVRLFLNAGLDIEAKDYLGKTPLYYAVSRGHVEAVKVLLRAGANINVRYVGRTLWHLVGIGMSLKKRSEAAIKEIKALLEEAGLDPNEPIVQEDLSTGNQGRFFIF